MTKKEKKKAEHECNNNNKKNKNRRREDIPTIITFPPSDDGRVQWMESSIYVHAAAEWMACW
jgi:hypothetical protein